MLTEHPSVKRRLPLLASRCPATRGGAPGMARHRVAPIQQAPAKAAALNQHSSALPIGVIPGYYGLIHPPDPSRPSPIPAFPVNTSPACEFHARALRNSCGFTALSRLLNQKEKLPQTYACLPCSVPLLLLPPPSAHVDDSNVGWATNGMETAWSQSQSLCLASNLIHILELLIHQLPKLEEKGLLKRSVQLSSHFCAARSSALSNSSQAPQVGQRVSRDRPPSFSPPALPASNAKRNTPVYHLAVVSLLPRGRLRPSTRSDPTVPAGGRNNRER